MTASETKKFGSGAAFGVYALYFMVAGAGAVTPAIRQLGIAFPDASYVTVTLIQSLPSLTCILGTLIMGFLAGKKIKFRTAGLIALGIYLVFGVLPIFWHDSIESVLVSRAMAGLGMGAVSPLGAAVLLRWFKDKEQRATYLGRGTAAQKLGGVCLTLLGGYLVTIDWTLTFAAYFLCVPGILLLIFAFKEPPTVDEIITSDGADTSAPEFQKLQKVKIPAAAWIILFIFTFSQIAYSPSMMNLTPLLGAATGPEVAAANGGWLLSLPVLAGALSAWLTDTLVKVFKKFVGPVGLIITMLGSVIIATAGSVPFFAIGMLVLGFGWGFVIPVVNLELGTISKAAALVMVSTLCMVGMNVGNFLASYWQGLIFFIVGSEADKALPLFIGAAVFVVLAIIWSLFNLKSAAWNNRENK